MGINVMVSDDQRLSRFALTALLEQHHEIRVAGSAGGGPAALELATLHRPDVVVMSYDGGDDGTIETAQKITGIPGCRTLLLATTFTRSAVRRAFTSGIAGIVCRSSPPRQFFEAIHTVHQGERFFDTELTVAAVGNGDCPLTLRQISVLEYVSRGDTVTEIAARLCLSEGTVRNYVSSAVAKLGARNRIDALRIARDAHWI
ncbi:putative two-component response regulator [Streptomyces sp. NBRC 110611]|nr:putative two-component response regulator [Streptomyces sp. NBRC 110611]